MEFKELIVSKGDLQKALQKVHSTINSKHYVPIMANYMFELADGELTLTGSNVENEIRTKISVQESNCNFSFCIETTILDALKTLPEQPITISANEPLTEASLIHSFGEIKFSLLFADQYALMKSIDGITYNIPSDRLRKALAVNVKQIADDELRPVMNGVFVDVTKDGATFVASNGHKLSKYTDLDLNIEEPNCFLLPRVAVTSIIKIIDNSDEDFPIEICVSDRNVSMVMGDTTLTTRQIEGKYPNYNSVIPSNNNKEMIVDSKDFSSIINRLMLASPDSTRLIKISATTKKCIVSAEDIDRAKSAKEETTLTCSDDIVIGIKGSFMQDLLSSLSGDIKLSFSEPSRAMLLEPVEQDEGTKLTMLLMPMMIND